jgi:hypothetical protein
VFNKHVVKFVGNAEYLQGSEEGEEEEPLSKEGVGRSNPVLMKFLMVLDIFI